jgi:hypothetical protein
MAAITMIKAIHSLIFLGMAAAILYTFYSGMTNRISRLTTLSIAAVSGEGLVFLMNNGRCPLTDLTENLGSEHGSVSDIFLPGWFVERIPILFSPLFAIGLTAIGVRGARRQPAGSVLSILFAILFVAAPWHFRAKERRARRTG